MSDGAWRYLRHFLDPVAPVLARGDVTDLYVNRPGELWVETLGGAIERHEVPALDDRLLHRFVEQAAAFGHQGISRAHPLLSATLPDGARLQAVIPPAVHGALALAIRKPVAAGLTLAAYDAAGAFRDLIDTAAPPPPPPAGGIAERLRAAVRGRRTILVSGGTSTGKTTFLNALLHEIPRAERLLTIEDTVELAVPHANAVRLVAARGPLGEAAVGADDLVAAALRMRPDRIILGELRGGEAASFLRAINSGHPGSMTSVHADSAEGAVEQIALLVLQAGTRLSRADVRSYVRQSIHVYVQLARIDGRRVVRDIVWRC